MRFIRWSVLSIVALSLLGCATGGVQSLPVRYEPSKEFPYLQQKLGPTVGLAPLKDDRPETLYIGLHNMGRGVSTYYKSEPFPLEMAVRESLNEALTKKGLKTVFIQNWDERPESLKQIETESVLMIHIKKFWVEGKDDLLFRTTIKTSVHLVIHLGVKKEGKVFTRNVEVEREKSVLGGGTEHIKQVMNEILTDVFDTFLSNPY